MSLFFFYEFGWLAESLPRSVWVKCMGDMTELIFEVGHSIVAFFLLSFSM